MNCKDPSIAPEKTTCGELPSSAEGALRGRNSVPETDGERLKNQTRICFKTKTLWDLSYDDAIDNVVPFDGWNEIVSSQRPAS